jgi:phosphatidylserine/phosphatidylglycerophosphate/cardiolipin synthase-like enzyme
LTYFPGATVTSDAGLLAFAELDRAVKPTLMARVLLEETRPGKNIRHHFLQLLRQAVYGRVAGYYEHAHYAERLGHDPAMRITSALRTSGVPRG